MSRAGARRCRNCRRIRQARHRFPRFEKAADHGLYNFAARHDGAARPLAADADLVRLARGHAPARAGRRDVRASSIFPGRQSGNLGEDFFRLCPLSSRCRNAPHNLRLPVGRDRAVARESSQYAFVTEVLAPNLEFLRRKLELIGDLDQRVAETVRVGPRKACRRKGVLKDLANGRGIRPMSAREADGAEAAGLADADLRRGKERGRRRPRAFCA
jgi:hypothetical protein